MLSVSLSQAKSAENEENHDDEPYQVNDIVHVSLQSFTLSETIPLKTA